MGKLTLMQDDIRRAIAAGDIKNVIVHLPPKYAMSAMTSNFPNWKWGK